ncbi:MAG: DinB family protein [Dehalococcoidia bacterium]
MSQRHDELRQSVTSGYEDMRALFGQLTPEAMQRPATDGWTVAQLAGHIAVSPRGQIFLINRLRKGRNATVPKPLAFIVNIRNWWMVRGFKNPTREELISALDDAHGELLACIEGISDEELDNAGTVFNSGYQTVFESVKGGADHSREHAAVLRAAAGVESAVAATP